jgi:hypothetical protein
MPQAADVLLREHVTLQCECVDRLYLNGYIPTLQVPGQLVRFLMTHRGNPIPSPALLNKMTTDFVRAVEAFAQASSIPVLRFKKGERKEDVARRYFERLAARGDTGVAMIGVAQERVTAFKSSKGCRPDGGLWFHYSRASVCVNQYYFYILDAEFGPTFIKISSYAPFTMRIWLNGHEWAKRRLGSEGLRYVELDNGFLSVEDATRLQAICDELGPGDIQAFFRRWMAVLPNPLSSEDRKAGYQHCLSILQFEFSTTQVFDRPARGREFFEEVIRDNLDLGRPDRVQLIFDRRVTRRTPGRFRTRVLTQGVEPSLHADYKNSKIKQYYKNGRALRTELTVNNTYDFGVPRGLKSFACLRELGRNANRRLLDAQSISHRCPLTPDAFQEVVLPTHRDGQRIPGLRFGDPRVMALLQALCGFFHIPAGFQNQDLRRRVSRLLDESTSYSLGRMTYDLRRLALNGLIERVGKTRTYRVTPRGCRVALLFTKTYNRVLRPAPLEPDAPGRDTALGRVWRNLDKAVNSTFKAARLAA